MLHIQCSTEQRKGALRKEEHLGEISRYETNEMDCKHCFLSHARLIYRNIILELNLYISTVYIF
jgi:hypothetical protein